MAASRLEEIPEWTFGERVRKARRTLGLSQSEMARMLEVPEKRYSNWESDYNLPRDAPRVSLRIQEVTGFPADWLLGLRTGRNLVLPFQLQLSRPFADSAVSLLLRSR